MKRIITLAAALLASLCALAQNGIVGGVTTPAVALRDLKNLRTSDFAGYRAGIAKYVPIGAGFAIQPEIVACSKGTVLPEGIGDVPINEINTGAVARQIKGSITYLEVPVQIQYGIDLNILRPYVFLEPFAGVALAGRADGTSVTFNELRQRIEYGLGIGGGLMLFDRIQVSLRYYWNMEDVQSFGDYTTQGGKHISDVFNGTGVDSFSGAVITAGIFF